MASGPTSAQQAWMQMGASSRYQRICQQCCRSVACALTIHDTDLGLHTPAGSLCVVLMDREDGREGQVCRGRTAHGLKKMRPMLVGTFGFRAPMVQWTLACYMPRTGVRQQGAAFWPSLHASCDGFLRQHSRLQQLGWPKADMTCVACTAHRFTFDHVYDQDCPQEELYARSAQQVVLSILQVKCASITDAMLAPGLAWLPAADRLAWVQGQLEERQGRRGGASSVGLRDQEGAF